MKIPALKSFLLSVLIITALNVHESAGQIGGQHTYSFLNTVPSARLAAVGGYQPSVMEKDPTLSYVNPALIDTSMEHYATLGYVHYLADINMGYASFTKSFEDWGTFQASMHFLDYGTFQRADQYGNRDGEFSAGDYALTIGHGYGFENFRAGANVKFIYSALESYSSYGLAFDAGGFYFHEGNKIGVGAVIRNAGMQLASYSGENREPLPLDIQVGISKELLNAPFRFSVTAHSLQNPDLTFQTGERTLNMQTGEWEEEEIPWTDKVFRHFTVATELLLGDNLQLRAGYNHQRRSELALDNYQGLTGFSWGAGLNISRFRIDFSRATYHLAAASTHLTVTTNMNEWFRSE